MLIQVQRLLEVPLTDSTIRQILPLASALARAEGRYRWFFQLLSACLVPILDDPDARDADRWDILMDEFRLAALEAVQAIQRDSPLDAMAAANRLAEAAGLMGST